MGFERYPALQDVGVKTWVNGAFTFSPDGNPLVGPVPGKRGYWSACAVMAGFLQGGGVGKSLAEWMIHGEPEADVYGMDVARYGVWAENKQYIKETTGQFYTRRFVMTYPNEQLPAGRPLKTAGAYADMTAAGCQWGQSWDLEVPLYFAEPGFEETPSLKRSNAHLIVADECHAVRSGVGLLDITGFSRFEVTGPNAEAWLDRIMASKLPKPGRAKLAPMLAEDGRLKDGTLVATVMSNLGLEIHLQGRGLQLKRTPVGARYVMEAMRSGGWNLGGEQSGHIIKTDYATTGDGLIAGLQFLAEMVRTGRPASELAQRFERCPQLLKNVRYAAGADPLQTASVKAAIATAEARLRGNGRL